MRSQHTRPRPRTSLAALLLTLCLTDAVLGAARARKRVSVNEYTYNSVGGREKNGREGGSEVRTGAAKEHKRGAVPTPRGGVKAAYMSVADKATPDTPYMQQTVTKFNLNNSTLQGSVGLGINHTVTQVEYSKGLQGVFLLTDHSLHFLPNGSNAATPVDPGVGLKIVPYSRVLVAPDATSGTVFVVAGPMGVVYAECNANTLASCTVTTNISTTEFGHVTALAGATTSNLFIGGSNGLYSIGQNRKNITQIETVQEPVTALALSYSLGYLAIGTGLRLYRFNLVTWSWRYDWVGGVIDSNITSLAWDISGTNLYIGNDITVNVATIDDSSSVVAWRFTRLGGVVGDPGAVAGNSGLPIGNITHISSGSPGVMWFGSPYGIVFYNSTSHTYNYWAGPRYFSTTAGSVVTGMDVNHCSGSAFVAVNGAFTIFALESWTLAEKAMFYQNQVQPRMSHLGLITGCNLAEFGNTNTWTPAGPGTSDALWTSMYLASQCFRYAVTKSTAALDAANSAFDALIFAAELTGIPGYVPRSYTNTTASSNNWYNSTTHPGWSFEGDTSSDTLTGYMFALPLYHDLVAQTSSQMNLASTLVANITNYIVNNDYYYIGVNGKPTTWGQWAPAVLNDDPSWFDERGTNSLELLSYLLSGYRFTANTKFTNAFANLRTEYGYSENINNCRMTAYNDVNFSDDELIYMSYFLYYTSTENADYLEDLTASLARTWSIVQSENSAFFNILTGTLGYADANENYGLAAAISDLQRWPLSLVQWPVDNTHRIDVMQNPLLERTTTPPYQTLSVLNADERALERWNADPFEINNGGNGMTELDPTGFLLPYWIGRYYGMISAPPSDHVRGGFIDWELVEKSSACLT